MFPIPGNGRPPGGFSRRMVRYDQGGAVATPEAEWPEEDLRGLLPSLRALALARLRQEADADDAVQETLVRVLQHRGDWRPDAPFANWVFTIAANVVRNKVREGRARRERPLPDAPSENLDPGAALQASEDLARILGALRLLEPEERAPILMLYVHGLPPREVAAHLDLSVEHLRVRLFRALKKIRERVKD
jgi:RNA polymerase sigma-70 factor (ECF subfamily)